MKTFHVPKALLRSFFSFASLRLRFYSGAASSRTTPVRAGVFSSHVFVDENTNHTDAPRSKGVSYRGSSPRSSPSPSFAPACALSPPSTSPSSPPSAGGGDFSTLCHFSNSSSSGWVVPQMTSECNGGPKSTSSSSLGEKERQRCGIVFRRWLLFHCIGKNGREADNFLKYVVTGKTRALIGHFF